MTASFLYLENKKASRQWQASIFNAVNSGSSKFLRVLIHTISNFFSHFLKALICHKRWRTNYGSITSICDRFFFLSCYWRRQELFYCLKIKKWENILITKENKFWYCIASIEVTLRIDRISFALDSFHHIREKNLSAVSDLIYIGRNSQQFHWSL